MAAKHVVMLLSNAHGPDVRVQREAECLAAAGYRVSIICWDREAKFAENETVSGVDIIRVQDVRSAYGLGWKQVMYLPRFWRKACRLGRERAPDVVHCHDLDTLYAGWRLKRMTGAVLVFDAHENYPATMSLYLPAVLVRLLTRWERWLIRKADAIITAGAVLREDYAALGLAPVVVLGNYADPKQFQALPDVTLRDARRTLGVPDEALLVSYIGGLHRDRSVLPFVEAAARCPDVHFAVWGAGDLKSAVEAAAAKHDNAHYFGWAPWDELPLWFQVSDVIYYGLRLDYPGAKYNAPNTLTQAMIMARPLIATNVGDLGRIVEASDCGVLIEEATPEAIAGAIEDLKNPERRNALGVNGYEAARKSYNADIVNERLLKLYSTIMT